MRLVLSKHHIKINPTKNLDCNNFRRTVENILSTLFVGEYWICTSAVLKMKHQLSSGNFMEMPINFGG